MIRPTGKTGYNTDTPYATWYDELWAIKMVMILFQEIQVLNAPKTTSLADQTQFEFVVEKIMHDLSG